MVRIVIKYFAAICGFFAQDKSVRALLTGPVYQGPQGLASAGEPFPFKALSSSLQPVARNAVFPDFVKTSGILDGCW